MSLQERETLWVPALFVRFITRWRQHLIKKYHINHNGRRIFLRYIIQFNYFSSDSDRYYCVSYIFYRLNWFVNFRHSKICLNVWRWIFVSIDISIHRYVHIIHSRCTVCAARQRYSLKMRWKLPKILHHKSEIMCLIVWNRYMYLPFLLVVFMLFYRSPAI